MVEPGKAAQPGWAAAGVGAQGQAGAAESCTWCCSRCVLVCAPSHSLASAGLCSSPPVGNNCRVTEWCKHITTAAALQVPQPTDKVCEWQPWVHQ